MTRAASDNGIRRAQWLVGTLVITGALAHVVSPFGTFGEFSYAAVATGAAVLAWLGVSGRPRGRRLAWAALAVGLTLSACGDLVYLVLARTGGDVPSVSIADAGWLAAYVGLFAGLLRLLVSNTRAHAEIRQDALLDLGSVLTVSVLGMWVYSGSVFGDTSQTLLERTVGSAYPLLDAALLAVAARCLLDPRTRAVIGAWLGFGVACWLFADFGSIVVPETNARLLDAGWLFGAALIAIGIVRQRSHRLTEDWRPTERRRHPWLMVGLLPLVIPELVDLTIATDDDRSTALVLLVGSVVMIALAYVRASLLMRRGEAARSAMAANQNFYRKIAAHSADALIVVGADGRVRDEVPKFRIAGTTLEHGVAGATFADLAAALPQLPATAFEPAGEGEPRQRDVEVQVEWPGVGPRWLSLRTTDLLDDPDVAGLVVNVHDISNRRAAEDALHRTAFFDPVTGLPNRTLYVDRLGHALARSARSGVEITVLTIDLDGFRAVNDAIGHARADEVLAEIAVRLSRRLRTGDTVARIGPDEFGAIVEPAPDEPVDSAYVAERIQLMLAEVERNFEIPSRLTASIGFTTSTGLGTPDKLMNEADLALHAARSAGRGHYVVFTPEMSVDLADRQALEHDLAGALAREEFTLLYQPVIDLAADRVVGFEALIRWQHPTRGVVSPVRFIPIAEQSGAIVPIGLWVLRTALTQLRPWQEEFPADPPLTMAVNASATQLTSTTLVDDIAAAIAEAGVEPSSVILELTETALVDDPTAASARLAAIRALGVGTAIDDFGTGYSSLSYLRQFAVDTLKIDRSFVQTITDEHELPSIVVGLLGLAHTLGLDIVAEGVEEDFQRRLLTAAGCQHAQGYLFSAPLAPGAVEALVLAPQRARKCA